MGAQNVNVVHTANRHAQRVKCMNEQCTKHSVEVAFNEFDLQIWVNVIADLAKTSSTGTTLMVQTIYL